MQIVIIFAHVVVGEGIAKGSVCMHVCLNTAVTSYPAYSCLISFKFLHKAKHADKLGNTETHMGSWFYAVISGFRFSVLASKILVEKISDLICNLGLSYCITIVYNELHYVNEHHIKLLAVMLIEL